MGQCSCSYWNRFAVIPEYPRFRLWLWANAALDGSKCASHSTTSSKTTYPMLKPFICQIGHRQRFVTAASTLSSATAYSLTYEKTSNLNGLASCTE